MWIVELRKVRNFASVYIESEKLWFGLKSMLIARASSQSHHALLPFMHLFFFSDCSLLEFMDSMTQNHNFVF